MRQTPKHNDRILYVCGAIGVPDVDRCNALARAGYTVTACELDSSTEYMWDKSVPRGFSTLNLKGASVYQYAAHLFRSEIAIIYGYNKYPAFLSAIFRFVFRKKTVSMNDSKFNDYRRLIFSDLLKSALLFPYSHYFAASNNAKEYLQYLGVKKPIDIYRCAIDIDRVANSASVDIEPTYESRHFIMIGRFIAKKNYHTALSAYEKYLSQGGERDFTICGYGELESELRERTSKSPPLRDKVHFIREATTKQVGEALAHAVALILPSTEEQFGIVITEALAAGVPVIASQVCGACDLFENGSGGFKVEPMNIDGIAMFMHRLADDEHFWMQQTDICRSIARRADISIFREAVDAVNIN